MTEALKELNDAVYTGGIASLSNTPVAAPTKPGEGDEGDEDVPPPPKAKGRTVVPVEGAGAPSSSHREDRILTTS